MAYYINFFFFPSFPNTGSRDRRLAACSEHEAGVPQDAAKPPAEDQAVPGRHVREAGPSETGACVLGGSSQRDFATGQCFLNFPMSLVVPVVSLAFDFHS